MKMNEDFNSVDELSKFENIDVSPEVAKAIVAAIMRSRAGLATKADVKESAANVTASVTAILKAYVTKVFGKFERRQEKSRTQFERRQNKARTQSENNLRQDIRQDLKESRHILLWAIGAIGATVLGVVTLLHYLPKILLLLGS